MNNGPSPQGQRQGQRRQRGRRRSGRQRGGPRNGQRPGSSAPSYILRDLLIVPNRESFAKLQEVRTEFDPLVRVVPPHITLLDPKPRDTLQNDYLKKLTLGDLPKLNELTFEKIIVHDELSLWLMPSHESAEKLKTWREAVAQGIPQDEFVPHITLGYLSRDLSAEDTINIAREKLRLPVTLVFEKLLLEEFSDNQVSVPVDSVSLS